MWELAGVLEEKNAAARGIEDPAALDEAYRDEVLPAMDELRAAVDAMEVICSKECWPVPSYNDMLFYVQLKLTGTDPLSHRAIDDRGTGPRQLF